MKLGDINVYMFDFHKRCIQVWQKSIVAAARRPLICSETLNSALEDCILHVSWNLLKLRFPGAIEPVIPKLSANSFVLF